MFKIKEVLTFILAGGRGERLDPLTRDRTKPAVPFGGIYRIIDFTLSNCINSGLRKVNVLTQYKSFSLQKHILSGWGVVSTQLGEFIDIIPAQQRINDAWYRGTADAIYQNSYAIDDHNPELVLILAGDHIYKMNYNTLIEEHINKKAEMTVACNVQPKKYSKNFGVLEVDKNNSVLGFEEKPEDPKTIPEQSDKIFASMGVYIFHKDVLMRELMLDAEDEDSDHDFGKNIIPRMIAKKKKVFVYNFVDDKNQVLYWRDIGTRDAYYEANMDLVGKNPPINIFDKEWPLRTYYEPYPPSKIVGGIEGKIVDSFISGGCVIESSFLSKCVLSPNVTIGKDARVENSVIMDGVVVGRGAKIKNAIIDKQVSIPEDACIGYNLEEDKLKFVSTNSGIIIVAKKSSLSY